MFIQHLVVSLNSGNTFKKNGSVLPSHRNMRIMNNTLTYTNYRLLLFSLRCKIYSPLNFITTANLVEICEFAIDLQILALFPEVLEYLLEENRVNVKSKLEIVC
jgi:hypothetical protein